MKSKGNRVRNRAKEIEAWQIQDFAFHGEVVAAEVEQAYRRGFTQGWSAARQTMTNDGATLKDIEAHEETLMKWRRPRHPWLKGQPVEAVMPPPCRF